LNRYVLREREHVARRAEVVARNVEVIREIRALAAAPGIRNEVEVV
jgi:hypothetical protein